jgi:Lsr2
MAKTVITQVTDDLDGSTGAETITFGFRGTNYEIDLGRRNASAFDKVMKLTSMPRGKSPLHVEELLQRRSEIRVRAARWTSELESPGELDK